MDSKEYDVLIIGAGVSGLTAAALLSRAGLKVGVFERHYLIGGYLQGFQRKDFIFDTAIHWLNQCGEGGTVTRIFDYIGTDHPRPIPMKQILRHMGQGHDYVLTNNPDELKDQWLRDFPEDKKGIVKFFNEAKKVARMSKEFDKLFRSTESMEYLEKVLYKIRRMRIGFPLVKHVFYSGEEGMKKGLSKYFTNPKLLDFFGTERDLLSCLFPIAWAYNNDYQNPPIGGSQAFPKWLFEQLNTQNGSEVVLNANVTSINVENNRFKSLTYVKRHKKYSAKAKYLLAACDVSKLYQNLLPNHKFTDEFSSKMNSSELYSSSVTISIALNCPAEDLGFGTELTLICNNENSRDEHTSGDPHKSAISVLAPTVRDKTMSPKDKGTLTLYVPAWIEYENYWKTERDDNGEFVRTEAYKQLKDDYAKVIFDRVEERLCPNLREHILFYEVATPITYYRYTKNREGSMMGTRPGKINYKSRIAHYKTPVENVIIAGHWAELGGGVPIATKAAYNASLIVLKEENPEEYKSLVDIMEKS